MRKINFKALLKSSRVMIPFLYRQQYKLDTSQILKVTVNIEGNWSDREVFLTHMRKDGNLGIPMQVQRQLSVDEKGLEGYSLEIVVEPA